MRFLTKGGAGHGDHDVGRTTGRSGAALRRHELLEETGLTAEVQPVETAGVDWALFTAAAGSSAAVVLSDVEHDRYAWVQVTEALRRCRPAVVADGIARAVAHLDAAGRSSCSLVYRGEPPAAGSFALPGANGSNGGPARPAGRRPAG